MQDRGENKIHWLGMFSDTDAVPQLIEDLSIGQEIADFIDCLFISDEQGELLRANAFNFSIFSL